MITVRVDLGERGYDVVVGDGARHSLAAVIPAAARRAAVITQASVGVEVSCRREQEVFTVPDGEAAKSMATVEDLCRRLARWGLTRGDVVVGVGGGVVTDLAGFVASIYLRGLPVVHVATTLLAQVDAAIGGKTGVNLPEGKNLVGAFWQPTAVLCDTGVLSTLPAREQRSGWGEVAKYHFIDPEGEALDRMGVEERVATCVRIKARFVEGDEREGGRRAVLNYGHTLAHALETAGAYDLRHGEAVAIGLVFAARLAHRLDRIDADRVARHREVLAGYDLPIDLPPGARARDLLDIMGRDKKAVAGLTFVLDGPFGVEAMLVDPADVVAVLEDMGAT